MALRKVVRLLNRMFEVFLTEKRLVVWKDVAHRMAEGYQKMAIPKQVSQMVLWKERLELKNLELKNIVAPTSAIRTENSSFILKNP